MMKKVILLLLIITATLGIKYVASDGKVKDVESVCTEQPIGFKYLEDKEEAHEAELIEQAVVSSIGTSEEVEVWGYDFTDFSRCIMAESGDDALLARMICTCVVNTQTKHDLTLTPCDVLKKYGYTKNRCDCTDAVQEAIIDVMLRGNTLYCVGDATMFYNASILTYNHSHESQSYIYSYESKYGEIRFFEEVD